MERRYPGLTVETGAKRTANSWPPAYLNSGVPGTKASNAAQNCAR